MAKKINFEDLVDVSSLKLLLETIEKVETKLQGIVTLSAETMKGQGAGYDTMKKQAQAAREATNAAIALEKLEKQRIETKEKLRKAEENEAKARENSTKLSKEEIQLKKLEIQVATSAEGSYNKLTAQYNLVKIALNKMSEAEREGSEAGRALVKTAADLMTKMNDQQVATKKYVHSIGNYKGAVEGVNLSLGEMKRELRELRNVSFTGKSEEEIKALKQRIGDLMDSMGDMKAEMTMMGTEKAAVLVGGLKLVSAGVESVVGSLSLFGVESETVEKTEKKLIALIAVTQALAEIEDTISSGKAKAMIIRIKSMVLEARDTAIKWANAVATQAQSRAEVAKATMMGKGSIVTKAAAAVQWAWNAALMANPIGIIIVAVAALAAGLAILIISTQKQTDAEKKANIERKANLDITQSAIDKSTERVVKLEQLAKTINSAKTNEHDYKEAIKELSKETGINLEKIKDRNQQLLIANELVKAQIKLIKLEANAEAAREIYIEKRKEQLKVQTDLTKSEATFGQTLWESIVHTGDIAGTAVGVLNKTMDNYRENLHNSGLEVEVFDKLMMEANGTVEDQKNVIDQLVKKYKLQYTEAEKLVKTTKELKKEHEEYNLSLAKELDFWIKGQLVKAIKSEREEELEAWRVTYDEKVALAKDNAVALEDLARLNRAKISDINNKWDEKELEDIKKRNEKFNKAFAKGIEDSGKLVEEKDKELRKKEAERRERVLTSLEDYLKTAEDKRQQAFDREIEQSKKHQDQLRELANLGSEDAKNNLAFEEKKQRELELKKEKALERSKKIEMGMAILKAYSKNLETATSSGEAVKNTIRDATLLTAFIKSLPTFKEGTEDTGGRGDIDADGGKLAVLHPHERVIPEDQNKLMAGLTNWELTNAALLYRKGISQIESNRFDSNEKILAKFDELKDTIDSKPVYLGSDYDKITHSITQIIEKGNTIYREHKTLRKL